LEALPDRMPKWKEREIAALLIEGKEVFDGKKRAAEEASLT